MDDIMCIRTDMLSWIHGAMVILILGTLFWNMILMAVHAFEESSIWAGIYVVQNIIVFTMLLYLISLFC